MKQPEIDIVIPVYNEGEGIREVLSTLIRDVKTPNRISLLYDFDGDNTLAAVPKEWLESGTVRFVKNERKGVHGAILTGFSYVTAPSVLVFPADDALNSVIVDRMQEKFREGADIVCASRFIPGGCMIGCPWLKAFLVRSASFTLHHLAGIPTHDSSNGFRLFSKAFLKDLVFESSEGFTYSIEALVKAHRMGLRVEEVPARWVERRTGQSRFKVLGWLPAYLRWYFYAFQTSFLSFGRRKAPARPGE